MINYLKRKKQFSQLLNFHFFLFFARSFIINHPECDTDEFSLSMEALERKIVCLLRPPIDVTHADMSYVHMTFELNFWCFHLSSFISKSREVFISLAYEFHCTITYNSGGLLIRFSLQRRSDCCASTSHVSQVKLVNEPIPANFTIKRNIYLKLRLREGKCTWPHRSEGAKNCMMMRNVIVSSSKVEMWLVTNFLLVRIFRISEKEKTTKEKIRIENLKFPTFEIRRII